MRLFVSVDIDELADEIAKVQEWFDEADGIRCTDPIQTHVTLKFLGETEADRLDSVEDEIEAAITDSGVAPFQADCAGLGVFPGLEYIRVVWLGFSAGGEHLRRLHEEVETRMTAIGFEPEDHEFTPHATIARMDHAGGKDHVQDIVQNREPTVGSVTVDTVCLTESTLTDDGPEYSTVERFSLGQGSPI